MVDVTRDIVHQFRDDWKASISKEITFKRKEFQHWHAINDTVIDGQDIIVIIFIFCEIA